MQQIQSVKTLHQHAYSHHYGGSGEVAHFYHANGFPIGTYQPLLSRLGQHMQVNALAMRPTWPEVGPPPKSRSWDIYALDLIRYIESNFDHPIIAIGHSMGATSTVIAAQMRPDLFKALVLIEVAMANKTLAKLARISPKFIAQRFEPAASTLKKVESWPSTEAYKTYCEQHPAYKRFDPEAMDALVQSGIGENQRQQYQIKFPKDWEAHNYTQPPNIMQELRHLQTPYVAIRGKPSLFFSEPMWQEWQQSAPKQAVFLENKQQGHLFPLENPSACAQLIQDGLSCLQL